MTALALLAIIVVATTYLAGWKPGDGLSIGGGGSTSVDDVPVGANLCGDTKASTMTLNLYNGLNTTGAEGFDATMRLYTADGAYVTELTDTTSASVSNLNCGQQYVLRMKSTDGVDGDSGQFQGIRSDSTSSAKLAENGAAVVFTATQPSITLSLSGKQHGVLEFKGYDNINRAPMCNGDDSCTDYELDGVTFMSTTNGTAMAVSTGGEVDISLDARVNSLTDATFDDFGFYILVEAPTAVWGEPVVSFDGQTLTNIKGSLAAEESDLWNGYEFVYKVETTEGSPKLDSDRKSVGFQIRADSGVDPGASDNLEIDFAAIGSYQSTSSDAIKVGGVTDASSRAAVFAVQDVTIDIS